MERGKNIKRVGVSGAGRRRHEIQLFVATGFTRPKKRMRKLRWEEDVIKPIPLIPLWD